MTTCSTAQIDSMPTSSAVRARCARLSGKPKGPALAYISPNFMPGPIVENAARDKGCGPRPGGPGGGTVRDLARRTAGQERLGARDALRIGLSLRDLERTLRLGVRLSLRPAGTERPDEIEPGAEIVGIDLQRAAERPLGLRRVVGPVAERERLARRRRARWIGGPRETQRGEDECGEAMHPPTLAGAAHRTNASLVAAVEGVDRVARVDDVGGVTERRPGGRRREPVEGVVPTVLHPEVGRPGARPQREQPQRRPRTHRGVHPDPPIVASRARNLADRRAIRTSVCNRRAPAGESLSPVIPLVPPRPPPWEGKSVHHGTCGARGKGTAH